jgi:uncharacterized peroxidase-related enzyme
MTEPPTEGGRTMPRLELVDPDTAASETREAYEEIRSDWGGMLFTDWRPLGNSPKIMLAAHKLFFYLQGEKGGSLTDVRDKELVAIRTSALNGCDYCLGHNVEFGQVVGLSLEEVQAAAGSGADPDALSERQRALLRWTDAVAQNTAAEDDAAFAELKRHYSDAEIAELTLMASWFNGWNRFTRSLHIQLEPSDERQLVACLTRTRPRPIPTKREREIAAED